VRLVGRSAIGVSLPSYSSDQAACSGEGTRPICCPRRPTKSSKPQAAEFGDLERTEPAAAIVARPLDVNAMSVLIPLLMANVEVIVVRGRSGPIQISSLRRYHDPEMNRASPGVRGEEHKVSRQDFSELF
jgi:hypothetical protein